MTDEKTTALFKRYKESGDIALRNQIAEKYLYIAEILAKKFVGRGVEYDDLKQVASYALLRGIDRFDVDMGMQFTTFITPTITGEIKNYFRDKSRVIKLPRHLSEVGTAVKKYAAECEAQTGEKPSIVEIARALKLTEEDVVRALEIGNTLSLDGMAAGEDGEGERSLHSLIADNEDAYEEFETKEALQAAMQGFTDTEKLLIKLRYVDALSQSDTAKKLGVSQMFVSRMERKLLSRLKEKLKDSF